MAESGYKITRSNYTLRTRHQSVSGGTVYERDFMTTTNLGGWDSGSIPYGESNFRMVYRPLTNFRKIQGDIDWTEWKAGDVSGYTKTSEDEPRFKPKYTSLLDFAYYGSCTELIKSTINNIMLHYPPYLESSDDVYTFKDGSKLRILENPFGMDLTTESGITDESYGKWHLMNAAWTGYTVNGETIENPPYVSTGSSRYSCVNNTITINGTQIFEKEFGGKLVYAVAGQCRIYPSDTILKEYWSSLDDFSAFLLNKESNPHYTVSIDYPHETERGIETYKKTFTWPSNDYGQIDVKTARFSIYVNGLLDLAKFYDDYFSDNLIRMMTNDSIKNMDITFTRPEKDEDTEDYNIGTGKIEGFLWAVGRLFDDVKRSIDQLKNAKRITYAGDNNVPDYYLTDELNLSGWETVDIGSPLSGTTVKSLQKFGKDKDYDYTDASVEFLKNLKLNTGNIFSRKGTRYAIENVLGMFGLRSYDFARALAIRNGADDLAKDPNPSLWDYVIEEYVSVVTGINGTSEERFRDYVSEWNRLRIDYPTSLDDEVSSEFYGMPVAEVVNGSTSYIVPWVSRNVRYWNGFYFQMNGGWARRLIDGDVEDNETIKYLHVVDTTKDLQNVPDNKLYGHRLCYVVDYSDWTGETITWTEDSVEAHYFKKGNDDVWAPAGSSDISTIIYLKSIVEDFSGNNPHVGYGFYDSGNEYIDRLSHLFKYEVDHDSPDNPMFSEDAYDCNGNYIDDNVDKVGFAMERRVDSQKVMYFHKNESPNTVENLNGEDGVYKPGSECFFKTDEYTPKNFETDGNVDNGLTEGSENSVVNLKNIKITFYSDAVHGGEEFERYIKECVMPYLTQVIPSTAIFEYEILANIGGATIGGYSTAMYENVGYIDGIVADAGEPNDDVVFNYNITREY